jgi:hypothetical protein
MLVGVGARLGYAARGAVYLSVGIMGLTAAADVSPHAVGAVDALEAWGAWPPGVGMLWITGTGLYTFAAWRALQSIFDADRMGASLKALGSRAGKAVSGLIYGGLAVSVFGLIDAMEDLREVDDQAQTQAAIQHALALPGGAALVLALGVLIGAAGLGNIVRAFVGHFTESLTCEGDTARWTGALARFGYAGRGVAMIIAGLATAIAGWNARTSEATGMGGALDMLKQQPFGRPMLAAIALGLIAFGLFGFMKAGLRRITI